VKNIKVDLKRRQDSCKSCVTVFSRKIMRIWVAQKKKVLLDVSIIWSWRRFLFKELS